MITGVEQYPILDEEDFICKKTKIKRMPIWMKGHNPIIICAEDFEETIDAGIERAFEDMWDNLSKDEFDSISDKLKNKIEKEVTKSLLKNCRGLG